MRIIRVLLLLLAVSVPLSSIRGMDADASASSSAPGDNQDNNNLEVHQMPTGTDVEATHDNPNTNIRCWRPAVNLYRLTRANPSLAPSILLLMGMGSLLLISYMFQSGKI